MLNKKESIAVVFCICIALLPHADASPVTPPPSANQTQQDKAREASLAPQQQEYKSDFTGVIDEKIIFPKEENCRRINDIIIESDNEKLASKISKKFIVQAKSHCLGIKGIRLLGETLQNELIARGYITSLIDIPPQRLDEGILRLILTFGKIGSIAWATDSDDKSSQLWSALPTSEGEILRLPDLEQGMANLQRTPGTSAHMQLRPGANIGESDVVITRKADKSWQVGAWLNDAGSRASGRYQGGGALYLYNLTRLNDILYVAAGGDVEFNQKSDGNHNGSLYYSVPYGYWNLSLYASQSEYLQQFHGRWSTTDYESQNHYYSATLSRMLSHTQTQKTTADLRVSKSSSRYYFGGSEVAVMRKQNPTWDLTLRHQHYFYKKIIDASLGVQNRLGWLSSTPTPAEKADLYDSHARVIHADLQALMKFDVTGDLFSYAPHLSAQFSPDKLSSDNMFNIGNRWSVRGFDGERTLSGSQGWYWSNNFIWDLAGTAHQSYLGIDVGRITGSERNQQGKVLSGAVIGLQGNIVQTQYDFFVGTPLAKPASFHTDSLNMGFSLQWRY